MNLSLRTLRQPLALLAMALPMAILPGCDSPPAVVYVLQAPQLVDLAASASVPQAKAGSPIVLHANRRTTGEWKQIRSKDLEPGQCWMAAIPPTQEPEVADNVLWRVEPATGARFNTDFRANRTREVIFANPGTYTLIASTVVWCESGRSVAAAPIQITVAASE